MKPDNLNYFVEWRPYIWTPVVRYLVQNPARFAGKRVLDLGCFSGRMSCYFGKLGASVVGVDLPHVDLEPARNEALKWGLREKVKFKHYNGNPANLEDDLFDFIFTKSVLVVVPQLRVFLDGLAKSLKIGGELIAAENNKTNPAITAAIVLLTGKRTRLRSFTGVDPIFLDSVGQVFGSVEHKNFFGLVTGIRTIRKK